MKTSLADYLSEKFSVEKIYFICKRASKAFLMLKSIKELQKSSFITASIS
jgi:hypothetical protein